MYLGVLLSSHSREVSVVLVVDEALQALLNVRLVLVYHLLVLLELRQLLQSHGIADGSVGSLRAEISGVGIGSGTSRVGLPTHFKIAKTTTSSWGVVVWGVVRGIVCGGGGLPPCHPAAAPNMAAERGMWTSSGHPSPGGSQRASRQSWRHCRRPARCPCG